MMFVKTAMMEEDFLGVDDLIIFRLYFAIEFCRKYSSIRESGLKVGKDFFCLLHQKDNRGQA